MENLVKDKELFEKLDELESLFEDEKEYPKCDFCKNPCKSDWCSAKAN